MSTSSTDRGEAGVPASLLARAVRRWRLRGASGRLVCAPDVRIKGRVLLPGRGTVRLGRRVVLDARVWPIELRAGAGAEIVIEDDAVIEGGCSIEALCSVHIGARSRLGAFSKVLDNHYHEAFGDRHRLPPSNPVVVEDDVVIGPRAVLLPGAHLGKGTRVGAATVLARRTPPGAFAAGQPVEIRRAG